MHNAPKNIAIIGGGAAGFFSAISAKQHHPEAVVTIFEKSSKVLTKVKVSGGGRCNVTHEEFNIKALASNYPRGEKFLRQAFGQFSVADTVEWFKERGVTLKVESDHRMFPSTNISQTIIDTFLHEILRLKINVQLNVGMQDIHKNDAGFTVSLSNETLQNFDAVIVAFGGKKTLDNFSVFKELGHSIIPPVPSLFTFNIPNHPITELMGLAVGNVTVKIQGSKLQNTGPLLVTHWGMSGPAILKLSSLAARYLAEKDYTFKIQVNWLGDKKEDELREEIAQFIADNGKKMLNKSPIDVPNRLWGHILTMLQISPDNTWNRLDKKSKNRIVNKILNDEYQVTHKTTFKEEFVICGGISLSNVSHKTMQSKSVEGLYFAGEALDIDGVTGGFNFQAAWTTGFIAGKLN